MNYLISRNELAAYSAQRKPVATYSMSGPFGIEILDEIELPATAGERKGEMRPCIVWRWSNEKNKPRVSGIRDLANDEAGFRVNRRWIKLSECVRA
jgi:hypothetical protein